MSRSKRTQPGKKKTRPAVVAVARLAVYRVVRLWVLDLEQ